MTKEDVAVKIKEILAGMDKEQTESDKGWWETSTGAKFGSEKLNEVISFVVSLHENG